MAESFKLPLYVRKAQRDLLPKQDESLKQIGELLGGEWTLEVDWSTSVSDIFNFFKEGDSFFESNREKFAVGLCELFQDHALKAITQNLQAMSQDDLVKESLQETLTAKKLRFSLNIDGSAVGRPGRPMTIDNGALVWSVDRGDIGNMHGQYDFFSQDLAKNVEKLL